LPRCGSAHYDYYAHVGEALESIQKLLMGFNVWDKPIQDVSAVDLRSAVGGQRTYKDANTFLFNQQLGRAGWLPASVSNSRLLRT